MTRLIIALVTALIIAGCSPTTRTMDGGIGGTGTPSEMHQN